MSAWPRRKPTSDSSTKKQDNKDAKLINNWPRGDTRDASQKIVSWPRRDIEKVSKKVQSTATKRDEEWLLHAYEKRKKLKKKRKLEEVKMLSTPQLVDEVDVKTSVTKAQDSPKQSLTDPTEISSSLAPWKPKPVPLLNSEKPAIGQFIPVYAATSASQSNKKDPLPPLKKLEWTAPVSMNEPVKIDADVSAWKDFAKKQVLREMGSSAISDNFVRQTMRKRVRGSSGKAKKRPQYLHSTMYDDLKQKKPEDDANTKDPAVYDGVDIIEECLDQPSECPKEILELQTPHPEVSSIEIPVPCCAHGIPCQRLIVQKKTKNHGRAFFACTRRFDEGRCDFFLWEQNHPAAVVQSWWTSNNSPTPLFPIPPFKSAVDILRIVFRHADFKPGQEWAVNRLLESPMEPSKSLLVLPTGSGKSLCYQLPALYLPGLTLVISPLISLMQDQLERLPPELQGRAASFSSSKFKTDQAALIKTLLSGSIKLLFVSPERVVTAGFWRLLSRIHVSLVCIDEAHCVSEWSHNFRPAFLRLGRVTHRATKVLALTATASIPVTNDIKRILDIPSDGIHRCSAKRSNLDLQVLRLPHEDDRYNELRKLLSAKPLNKGSVIVYVHTQYAATQVAGLLTTEANIKASAYHAGLASDVKDKVQKGFSAGKIRVVVATIAFGMGIDKANVRGVVHYHMPSSMEHYVQHIGRAGRDGKMAHCVLLLACADFIRFHSLAHSDGLSMPQVMSLVNILFQHTSLISPNHSNVTHSIAWLESQLDMKNSVIDTILTTLELQGIIQLHPSQYATCAITVHQHQMAKWKLESLYSKAQECAEISSLQDGYLCTTTYTLNVVEFTQIAFPTRQNEDVMFMELRRLVQLGIIQYKLSEFAIHYHVVKTPSDLSTLAHSIYIHHNEQEARNVMRIETLYHVLECAAEAEDTTTFINEAIEDYFEGDGNAKRHVQNTWLNTPLEETEQNGIRIATAALLDDERITSSLVSAQSITRILHGLSSPRYSITEWRDHKYWGKFSQHPFNRVKSIVHDVVTEHKKASNESN